MRFPWVNLALFFLLGIQVITGYLGLVNGRSQRAWILWFHGIGAYALIFLFYWKSQIVWETWRRKRRWTGTRQSFVLMLGLLILVLVSGLVWSFVGPIYLGGFSLISIHMYLAVLLIPLLGWHVWRMRFVWRLPAAKNRRLFTGTAVSLLAGLLLWQNGRWLRQWTHLSGASRRFTGSYETGSNTGLFPVVSWIADNPPPVNTTQWQLIITGAVTHPLHLTYDQLLPLADEQMTATLDCTGGWYTTQTWRGVRLSRLLQMAGLTENALSITVRSVTGYQRRFTVAEGMGYLLATHVAERPLTHGHGFPLRLVAPDQRGVNWVKWVQEIQINQTSKIWQLPLPLQ
ncbi:MAG: sulfite oxidase [Chloroflexi bacterium]|nr:MAG: sulfite oxidase [Chloroflexota bacterium]